MCFFFVVFLCNLFLSERGRRAKRSNEGKLCGWLAGLYLKKKKIRKITRRFTCHSVCKRPKKKLSAPLSMIRERSRDFTHLPIYLGGVMSISWLFVLLFIFWRFCFIAEFRRSQWRVTDWLIEICLFFPSPKFRIWNKCKQLRKRVILPVVLFCFSGVDELQASKEKTFFVCFDI